MSVGKSGMSIYVYSCERRHRSVQRPVFHFLERLANGCSLWVNGLFLLKLSRQPQFLQGRVQFFNGVVFFDLRTDCDRNLHAFGV
jgi:hypothetical protein